MDISFVILTWNSEKFIGNCLESILKTVDCSKYEYEIFIVDNDSTDGTRNILAAYKRQLAETMRVILLAHNYGTTISRNLAFRKAKGRYIVALDSDVELMDGTIDNLVAAMNEPSIGLVAPRLVYPDGEIQKSTDTFPTITSKILRLFFLKKMERSLLGKPIELTTVDYAISALWLFRRTLFDTVGLLDEKIFFAPEDADFCLSIWKHGLSVFYCPDAVAIHHTQEISRGFRLNRAKLDHVTGLFYFFRKHGFLFKAPAFR